MSDHVWQSVSHMSLTHSHIAVCKEPTTGICRETHTTCRNGEPTDKAKVYYYHHEGRFPHETYEAALTEAREKGWRP